MVNPGHPVFLVHSRQFSHTSWDMLMKVSRGMYPCLSMILFLSARFLLWKVMPHSLSAMTTLVPGMLGLVEFFHVLLPVGRGHLPDVDLVLAHCADDALDVLGGGLVAHDVVS